MTQTIAITEKLLALDKEGIKGALDYSNYRTIASATTFSCPYQAS
jgi:hypothetical protein